MLSSLITLDRIHKEYLRYRFQSHGHEITVSRKDILGKHICSLVTYCDLPTEQKGNITLIIPSYEGDDNKFRFAYINILNQQQIRDYIDSVFFIDFINFMNITSNMGMRYQDRINSFIQLRGLDQNNFEMLKKNYYRFRKKIEISVLQTLDSISNKAVKKFYTEFSFSEDTCPDM